MEDIYLSGHKATIYRQHYITVTPFIQSRKGFYDSGERFLVPYRPNSFLDIEEEHEIECSGSAK
jgi:hypothetical protein